MRHFLILPGLLALTLAACSAGDPRTRERLACLGETPAPGCTAIWDRDLGLGAAGGGSTAALAGGGSRGAPAAGPPSTGRTGLSASSACSLSGQSYPTGSSTRVEITSDIQGFGMVRPRPGDGRPRERRCTCQAMPGGGVEWSCR